MTFAADDAGERLDVVLARRLPQYSRARLQRWIDAGRVLVDGAVPARRVLVRAAQQARIDAEFIA
ncbi:MAG: S4 domain-containing protein, partial [Gammaproteobacteria bacterium]